MFFFYKESKSGNFFFFFFGGGGGGGGGARVTEFFLQRIQIWNFFGGVGGGGGARVREFFTKNPTKKKIFFFFGGRMEVGGLIGWRVGGWGLKLVIFFYYEPKFKIKKNCFFFGGGWGGGEGAGRGARVREFFTKKPTKNKNFFGGRMEVRGLIGWGGGGARVSEFFSQSIQI